MIASGWIFSLAVVMAPPIPLFVVRTLPSPPVSTRRPRRSPVRRRNKGGWRQRHMEQDLPAGKAVEPRHLQKLRVYTPHAWLRLITTVGMVDVATMNTQGQPLNPNHTRASTTQHTGGTDWSTWMNGIPTSSSLGTARTAVPAPCPPQPRFPGQAPDAAE